MNARHPSRATQLIVGAAFLAATAAVLMISSTPVLAFTCEDVRGLTKAKQNYWSKLLNLTPDQRHRIWLECYSQARVVETKDNSLKPLVNGQ
jgi:Spy/CpxP family protein refolding chaperone